MNSSSGFSNMEVFGKWQEFDGEKDLGFGCVEKVHQVQINDNHIKIL